MLFVADVIAMTAGRIMPEICGRCFSHSCFCYWQMLAMIVDRCCTMNFVANVISTMTAAKWADVVTPCEELMQML